MTPSAPSVGVYGGTFNPIHVGHLRAAGEVADALELAEVRFVPSWSPPHKRDEDIADAKDRLEWVRRAVESEPRFVADAIEVERGGASYLVDTLRKLRAELAPAFPVFLVGSDAFREMGEWREPRELFFLAHFAVMNRPPETPDLAAWIPDLVRPDLELAADGASARHRGSDTWVRAVPIRGIAVSASEIRARLREGRSVRYLVPEAARAGIEACPSYAPPQTASESESPPDAHRLA